MAPDWLPGYGAGGTALSASACFSAVFSSRSSAHIDASCRIVIAYISAWSFAIPAFSAS